MDLLQHDAINTLWRKFSQINTHLTFLSSHSRSTIPTYDIIAKLNPSITPLDLAMVAYLLPRGDVFYDYVDENQVSLTFAEVKFDWKSGYEQSKALENAYDEGESRQLLIFEFTDVKTHGIASKMFAGRKRFRLNEPKLDFFLLDKDLSLHTLTQAQLLGIIRSRNEKFKACLHHHFENVTIDEGLTQLTDLAGSLVPEPPTFENVLDKAGPAPVSGEKPTIDEMLDAIKDKDFYQDQIKGLDTLTPAQPATFAPLLVESIHPDVEQALIDYKNISLRDGLYSHQTKALENISEGRHVIVSTSTSSGKSLIYQIPIINDIVWDIHHGLSDKKRLTTAFFIFPTKALAQDQKRHLQDFINLLPCNEQRRIIVETYDGDTSLKARSYARRFADIIFTNPDTIHASILPNHDLGHHGVDWGDFLLKLKYVVMDELHVYKGTFGIHVSYVMARLNRLKHHVLADDTGGFGHRHQYISCSATISDPIDHFQTICAIKDSVVHIDEDGSPMARKMLVVWNPPPLMNRLGQSTLKSATSLASPVAEQFIPRENVILAAAKLLVQLLTRLPSIKVIVFCTLRKLCELMMKEVRALIQDHPTLTDSDIMSYRGGYAKVDRRNIENRMFSGQLRAIVATSALELGIDLSDLDVVIAAGFPKSKANLHQQFGRAGRGRKTKGSLAIYVAGSTPVDQYYLAHQDEIVQKSYEDLCVGGLGSLNQLVMEMHMQCAAYEKPLTQDDFGWFVSDKFRPTLLKVCREHLLEKNGTFSCHPKYLPRPCEHVSIRAIEDAGYAVVDITDNRNIVIEEIEASRTSFTIYEGAIFLHQGNSYLVKEFNTHEKYAKVLRVNVDWITQQRDFTDVDPTEIEAIKCLQPDIATEVPSDVPVFFGKIEICTIVFGYFKVNRRAEILEAVEVNTPPVLFKSKGFWIDIPNSVLEIIRDKHLSPAAGIHAAQHAIMNILPLFVSGGATTVANARFSSSVGDAELLTECKAPEKEFAKRQTKRKRPARLIFYDSKGGPHGSGIAYKTFQHIDDILLTTYDCISKCECEWGCPMCVAATFCKELSLVISKPAAQLILACLCGLDIDTLKHQVKDGPEANLPKIQVETITGPSHVKFSQDLEIIEVRKAKKPKKEPTVKEEPAD